MTLNLDKSTWKRVAFGDVAEASKEQCDPADGSIERYVAGEHMDTDDLRIHRSGEVGDGYLGPAFHRRFHPGQVLYGSRRTYLRKVAIADFGGVCANTTFVVQTRNSDVFLPDFLPFVMTSEPFHAFAITESKGSVNPYVNWSDIARYEFELPPLTEQKRLADLLWAAECEVRAVAGMANSIERMRSALRDTIFRDLDAEVVVAFESICLIASQNGLAAKKESRSGLTPMVNMGQMFRDEVLGKSDFERVSLPSRGFCLTAGDLLFARRSIVFEGAGTCCLVPELSEPHTFESSIIRVTPDSGLVDSTFLLHFFRSSSGRELMARIVRRGPVSGIAGSDLRKLSVPLPSKEVQERIVDDLSGFEPASSLVKHRLTRAKTMKASLSVGLFGPSA